MASQITTYAGLKAGMLAWLARPGDTLLDSRFDDFLLNCERRVDYGVARNSALPSRRGRRCEPPEASAAAAEGDGKRSPPRCRSASRGRKRHRRRAAAPAHI